MCLLKCITWLVPENPLAVNVLIVKTLILLRKEAPGKILRYSSEAAVCRRLKSRRSQKFPNIHGKTPIPGALFNKIAGIRSAT